MWSTQVTFFLRGIGLFGYLTGTTPIPPVYSPEFAIWEQQDCALVSFLMSTLSDSVMSEAVGMTYSREL